VISLWDETQVRAMQRTSSNIAVIGSAQPRRASGRRNVATLARTQSAALPLVEPFRLLTAEERVYLQNWWKRASLAGIDMVEDLIARPWPRPVADAIIGVFRSGEELATWMVIGRSGAWVVACCSDGKVSTPVNTLEAALSQIHPVDDPI
jgi:hypothetical protein